MADLIDTDVLIDVSRNNEAAIDFLDQLTDSWSISIITALELIVGARNKKEVTQIDQLDRATSYGLSRNSRPREILLSSAIGRTQAVILDMTDDLRFVVAYLCN